MDFPIVAAILFSIAIASSSAEKAPYASFARDATSASPEEYYDYIIVGGGTAGCALAATLSTAAKVLVLERGGLPYDNPNVMNKTGVLKTLLDTSPTSAAQPFVSTDGVFNHRARILGGGSAINAGFYSRASSEEVAEAGWEPRLVEESYEWVERKLVFRPPVRAWQAAVRDGLLEGGVVPFRGFTYEHLIGTKIGGTIFDENGGRHTAADLLEYADPAGIIVYLHATVHQILINTSSGERPKAYGVSYTDSRGARHMAYLKTGPKSEVILSTGALGSPQLLMLSGIGPAQQLKSHGVGVILDQPMVGQGISDNPMNMIMIPSRRPVEISQVEVVGIADVGSYIESVSGLVDFSALRRVAQVYAKLANKTIPTLKTLINITIPTNIQAGLIGEKAKGPYSTGHMELKSKDPNDNPRVTFNYFQDPRDLERCIQGLEIIKKVVESRAISAFMYPLTTFQSLKSLILAMPLNLRPRHLTAIDSMEQFCKDTVMTIWHYHGGCQVDRVVDRDYKILGVDALRVVDGPTFNNSPGTNPQATLMMLGRYMGQKILLERI